MATPLPVGSDTWPRLGPSMTWTRTRVRTGLAAPRSFRRVNCRCIIAAASARVHARRERVGAGAAHVHGDLEWACGVRRAERAKPNTDRLLPARVALAVIRFRGS